MKKTLVIILVCCSVQLFSQEKQREIGIDLYSPSYEFLHSDIQNWTTLRTNYKINKNQLFQRYTAEFSLTRSINFIVFDTLVYDISGNNTPYFNKTRRLSKVAFYYGLEKTIPVNKGRFFYGADIGLKLIPTIQGPIWSEMLGYDYFGVEQLPIDKRPIDITFVLTPFGGFSYPITKKILFNAELGFELNYLIEKRTYFIGEDSWEERNYRYFDFPALRKLFINNIGFSYRF